MGIFENKKMKKRNEQIKNVIHDCFKMYRLSKNVEERVADILSFILISDIEKSYVTYNVLIKENNLERANEFVVCLQNALLSLIDGINIDTVGEEEFLENEYVSESLQIVCVKGFSKENADRWMNKSKVMEANPSVIVFAIGNEEDADFYYETNQHLFFRVFTQRIMIEDYKWEDIAYETLAILENDYKCKEDFKDGINEYVKAVYDKADLKGGEFKEDLKRRVIELYRSKNKSGHVLDSSCVPTYNRQPVIETDVCKKEESTKVEQLVEPKMPDKIDEDICKNVYELIDYSMDDLRIFDHKKDKDINVLLLPLSTFPNLILKVNKYHCDGEEDVSGCYQLDPAVNYLKRKGKKFDCIMLLASTETMKLRDINILGDNVITSPVMYFINKHRDILTDVYSDNSNIVMIKADEGNPENTLKLAVGYLRKLSKLGNVKITMDNHGGLRHQQVYVLAIMNLMQHENIEIEEAYTVTFDIRNEDNNKVLIDDSFNAFNLTSAIDEFIHFGRMESIVKYYELLGVTDKNNLPEILKAIHIISDGIQSGFIPVIQDGVNKLRKCYANKEEIENEYLSLFLDLIYDNYGDLLRRKEDDVRDYIRWCIKNNLYQQALTFIEARVPGFLVQKKVIIENSNTQEYLCKLAKLKQRKIKNISVSERINDCWNDPGNKSSNIHYTWIQKEFNDIFENISNVNSDIVSKLVKEIDNNKKLSYAGLINELFSYGGIKAYDLVVDKKDDYMCAFFLLHKTIKDCRNNVNHLKENNSYKLKALRNAIKVYLVMLDEIVEDGGRKQSKIVDIDKPKNKNNNEVNENVAPVVEEKQEEYTISFFKKKKKDRYYTLQGIIKDVFDENNNPVRGVVKIDCDEKELKEVYLIENNEFKVTKDGVLGGIWQCELIGL